MATIPSTKRNAHKKSLKNSKRNATIFPRSRIQVRQTKESYIPPEDWYEHTYKNSGYKIIQKPAGKGYIPVVTPAQIRDRLGALPSNFLESLEVVQLSSMTRKKERLPCYGMPWGQAIYLYPMEDSLIENFYRPPRPSEYQDAKKFGGRWEQKKGSKWDLIWTPQTIKDFYLDHVLIHEVGHLIDTQNKSHRDRERFAEWFAIEYGRRYSSN